MKTVQEQNAEQNEVFQNNLDYEIKNKDIIVRHIKEADKYLKLEDNNEFSNGLVIIVPRGIKTMLKITKELSEEITEKNIIVIEENSELLIEYTIKNKTAEANVINSFILKENSRCRIKELHFGDENASINVTNEIAIDMGASMVRTAVLLAEGENNITVNGYLNGENAEISNNELFFGNKVHKSDSVTNILHAAPKTRSRINVRGIMLGASTSFVHGTVKIVKSAVKSNTFLNAHALLLSKDATARIIPALEIENSDVQAGHSASAAPIEEEHIFYLMSRGIERENAEKIIAKGFVARALDDLDANDIEEIIKIIEEKWNKK